MARYRVSTDLEGPDTVPVTLNEDERVRSILQNIRMILRTPLGSVPMYRDFGLDWSFLDRPVNQAKIAIIPAVREAVQQWEPRAEVTAVTLSRQTGDGIARVEVEVEINGENG